MEIDETPLTPEEEYRYGRLAAVSCGEFGAGHENCRHAWNAAHPDDPVTREEQLAHQAQVVATLLKA